MAKKTHVIYLITINDTPYVGQTGNFKDRKSQHLRDLKSGKHHNRHLQRTYDKYGPKSVKWHILERCSSKDVDCLEQEWIAIYDSHHNGFNQTITGGVFSRPCKWNGVIYPSISAAADAAGLSVGGLIYRLEQGHTCDLDAFGLNSDKNIECTWNGVLYPSLKAAAIANNVTLPTMHYRLKNGYASDDDLKPGKPSPCTWNGIEHPSMSAAARHLGINVASMHERLSKGYTCDADMKRPYGTHKQATGIHK